MHISYGFKSKCKHRKQEKPHSVNIQNRCFIGARDARTRGHYQPAPLLCIRLLFLRAIQIACSIISCIIRFTDIS